MTIKEIDKKYQDYIRNRQNMVASLNDAERRAKDLNAEAEGAAVSGDVQRYRDLKAQAMEEESLAYVIGKQLDQDGPIFTENETREAWKAYAEDHNKALKAKLKRYNETKTDLLRQYAEMVSLQRETCAVRERLARYIGVTPSPAEKDHGLASRFPMEYIPCKDNADAGSISIKGANVSDPDAVYYLASMEMRAEDLYKTADAQKVVGVVKLHHAK